MSSLAGRVETIKLAAVLDTVPEELDYLAKVAPEDVRALREAVDEALFLRHEPRFRRIAKVAASVPVSVSARVAQLALPPMLGARVAAVMEPATAIKLAGSLDTSYLTNLSVAIDPTRAQAIIAGIPAKVIVKVGTELVRRREHVALGRFVSVIEPETALKVVERASGEDLLRVALFADDPSAIDAFITRIDDSSLRAAISAAHDLELYDDAVTLLASVSQDGRDRLVPMISELDPKGRDAFARSLHRHDVWEVAVPSLVGLDDEQLAAIANTEATLDDGMVRRLVEVARDLGHEDLLERLPTVLDAAHQKTLKKVLT